MALDDSLRLFSAKSSYEHANASNGVLMALDGERMDLEALGG